MYWAEWIPYFPFKSQCHTSKQSPIGSARRCYKLFFYTILQSTLEFLCHKNPQQPEHIRFEEAWDVMGCFPLPCQHYSSVALLCLDARCLGFFACGRTMLQIESTSNGLTNIHKHVFFCCFRLGRKCICSVFLSHISSFFTDYMEQASSTPIPTRCASKHSLRPFQKGMTEKPPPRSSDHSHCFWFYSD